MSDDDSTDPGGSGRHRATGSDEPPWPLSEQKSSSGDGKTGLELPQLVGRDEEADEDEGPEAVRDDHRGWKYIYRTRIRTSTVALVIALITLSVLFMYTSEYYGTEPATPTRTQAPDGDEVWVTPSVTPRESEPETTPTTGESEDPGETGETGETGTQTTGTESPTEQSPGGGTGNQPQQQQQESPQTTEVPSG